MTIIAAADGSSLGNPGPAGWCWYIDDQTWAAGGWASGTNNRGELMAVAELLNATSHRCNEKLSILCDSQYVINSVTKWMPGWKRKGWRKRDGKPVLNVDILKQIDALLAGRDVHFEWVKGHSGHDLNEAADDRARAVATAYQSGNAPNYGPGFPGSPGPLPGSDDAVASPSVSPQCGAPVAAKGQQVVGADQGGLFELDDAVTHASLHIKKATALQKSLLRAAAKAVEGDTKRVAFIAKHAVVVPSSLKAAFPAWLADEQLVDQAEVHHSGTTAVVVLRTSDGVASSTWDLAGDGVLVAHHVSAREL